MSVPLVLLLTATVAHAVIAQTTDATRADQQVVTLGRAGCPGCPAYSVTVTGSGHVEFTYKGVRPRTWAGGTLHMGDVVSATADSQQVAALFHQIDRDGFFDISENWMLHGPNCQSFIPDGSSVTVSVTMKGRQHRVDMYSGCRDAPSAFGEVATSIDKVANVGQWLQSHP
jgi:hypothetical protein